MARRGGRSGARTCRGPSRRCQSSRFALPWLRDPPPPFRRISPAMLGRFEDLTDEDRSADTLGIGSNSISSAGWPCRLSRPPEELPLWWTSELVSCSCGAVLSPTWWSNVLLQPLLHEIFAVAKFIAQLLWLAAPLNRRPSCCLTDSAISLCDGRTSTSRSTAAGSSGFRRGGPLACCPADRGPLSFRYRLGPHDLDFRRLAVLAVPNPPLDQIGNLLGHPFRRRSTSSRLLLGTLNRLRQLALSDPPK